MSNDDTWNVYRLKIDGHLGLILVNISISNRAPISNLTNWCALSLTMQNPRHDGVQNNGENEMLYKIEDSLEANLDLQKSAYVGRDTSEGVRRFYFYTDNIAELKTALSKVMNDFPTYEYKLAGKRDDKWSLYFDYLYPSEIQFQQIADGDVLNTLQNHGDNTSIPREIDHMVYFNKKSGKENFKSYLSEQGFELIQEGRESFMRGNYFIEFKRIDVPDDITEVTYSLFNKCIDLGGKYDAWGCEVQKKEANANA